MSPITKPNVLVSGAGIAGATLAYWLDRGGFTTTVIERSPALRDSGQNVDVRDTGREVLRRMGLEDRVRSGGTGEVGLRFVDDAGRAIAEFPVGDFAGGDGPTAELEILRGELAKILLDATGGGVEVAYGERIESVVQDDSGVDVTFHGGVTRRFDLLLIAEGIRSTTRNAVFGGAPAFRDLGFYTAYCTLAKTTDDDRWWRWYSTTGARTLSLRPDNVGTTRAGLTFGSEPNGLEYLSRAAQVEILQTVFGDVDYLAPRILESLSADPSSLYVDRLAQVKMPSWSRGRVAVVGDAAYCSTPISGMGTSLALTGAYLLAQELVHGAGHREAFASYERLMRPIVDEAQKLPPGSPGIANPKSRLGLRIFRTAVRVFGSRPVRAVTARLMSSSEPSTKLPAYGDDVPEPTAG